MNQILYSRKKEKKAKRIAIALGILFMLAILVSVIFYIININNEKILNGVYVNDIYVGELTKEEANLKIVGELSKLREKEVILKLNGEEFKYTFNDLGLSYEKTLLSRAYEYGRSGNIIADNYTILSSYLGKEYKISEGLEVDNSRLDVVTLEMIANIKDSTVNDTHVVENDKIIITKGHDGISIKKEELKEELEKILSDNKKENMLEVPVDIGKANRIDIEELYEKVYVEKVDASYKAGETFEVIKEVEGISFDKEKAKEAYNKAQDGEKIEIILIKEEPKTKVADLDNVLFKDVLAEFTTKYDQSYTARVTNLQVAAKNINGTILYPGDEFSYNKVVGERTAARGFKEAHVFSGGKVVDGLGGGICQVSSTLYNAVLLANLDVTDRTAHMMHTGYVEPSLDATVVYGSIDFKFKNNRETPIKIEATVKNGKAITKIYGLKSDKDVIVELESKILETIKYTTVTQYDNTMNEGTTKVLQSPMNGYKSEAYKIIKDANGNVISRTLISKDNYKQTSKIVAVGTKKVEVKPPVVQIPDEPVVTPPAVEPVTPPTPVTPPEDHGSDLPTGWDTPENPYYN